MILERRSHFTGLYSVKSPVLLYILAILLVGLIGLLDYSTGYELAFYPFYSIPILWMVWRDHPKGAIAIAVLSAAAWCFADWATGHIYSQAWLRFWDTVVHLIFFLLVMAAGLAFKKQRDLSRAQLLVSERARLLEAEINNASEREKTRVGRDLHDSVCQDLVVISYSLRLLKEELEEEAPAKAPAAGEIAELLQEAIVHTRDLAHGLSPVDSDEDGLASALEQLAARTSKLSGVQCSFIYPESVRIREHSRAINLFRITQEAVANALKHGHPTSIIVALESSDSEISLRITDDGVGFDPENVEKQGMGLSTMRYRAKVEGGDLEIERNPPHGVAIICSIPLNAVSTETR
jgi:signal transduction histidine kinase